MFLYNRNLVNMSQNYNITITGGTSPGPYNIYYNSIDNNHIALKYLYYTPATGVTLNELVSGYYVTVPDDATILYLYNTDCRLYQELFIESATTTYDFCLVINADTITHFNSNGLYNGYQSWISDDESYLVIWDGTINKWKVSGNTFGYEIVSNSTYPPISGWYTIGGGQGDLTSYSGRCDSVLPLSLYVNINQPTCECDGSIVLVPSNGQSPYQYSIDNGVTYSNSPIFNNLCEGTYTAVVMDDLDNTFYSTVQLINSEIYTTYSLNVVTTSSVTSSTPYSLTKQYNTVISVTPPLPSGVTINFDVLHTNVLNSSPGPTTASLINNNVLNKNSIPQGSPLSTVGVSFSTNTLPGCQSNMVYKKTTNDVWSSVTMGYGDAISIDTTTTVNWSNAECLVAEATDTYTIDKIRINGCSCCVAILTSGTSGTSGNGSIF